MKRLFVSYSYTYGGINGFASCDFDFPAIQTGDELKVLEQILAKDVEERAGIKNADITIINWRRME
jgi:hypothetical protein